ncbi:MAG: DUF58 domain-containing protein [Akkermansiaceae bacterium]|nr:DUF58 domain-containing protein [Akkermansiaceae bacterium]
MRVPPPPLASGKPARGRAHLDQRLHKIYSLGAAFHDCFGRHCRPAGIALGVVLLLATCLAIGHGQSSIYQVFSLSLGMILIGALWAFSRSAVLEAKRELPRFATAGVAFTYTVQVSQRGKGRLSRAWLIDTPPNPRPSLEAFSVLREPGEDERNRFDRHFAYFRWRWILQGNRYFTGGQSSTDIDLLEGQQTKVSMSITPQRRGVITFDDLRVILPDPFGLFQRCRKVQAPTATLTILPRRFALPPVELPGAAAFKISGEASATSVGTTGEFVGLREYRPGDSLRQIDWKSWARTGRPIVKELEDTFHPRYGLIVDTLSCNQTDHSFEEVVSVAASFAACIDTNESLLDLMFIKNTAHRVTAGRGMERAEKLLQVLAAVSPERKEKFTELAQLVLRHGNDLTSCLVIFNGWDTNREKFLNTLRSSGVICSPIIIGIGPAPVGIPGYWIESGCIARDLQRLPKRL